MTRPIDHISFELLADLAESRVAPQDREPLMNHLRVCSDCARTWQDLGQLVGLMRSDDSADAPQPVIARALNIFQPKPRRQTATPSLVGRLLASLSFDSLNVAPAFGVRSGQATTRQLIFSAGDVDIDLRIAAQDDRFVVSGQVLGTECGGAELQLQNESVRESALLNDLCEFTLAPVGKGTYSLRLRLDDMEIEFPEIELKA
jgi:hypothetical protein